MITPYHLLLRMPRPLEEELNQASRAVGISKSMLTRMGLSRLLHDLKSTGRFDSMAEFNRYYREIA